MSLINPQPSLEGKDSVETSGSIQEKDWLNISREAYDSSTEYMDSNLRSLYIS